MGAKKNRSPLECTGPNTIYERRGAESSFPWGELHTRGGEGLSQLCFRQEYPDRHDRCVPQETGKSFHRNAQKARPQPPAWHHWTMGCDPYSGRTGIFNGFPAYLMPQRAACLSIFWSQAMQVEALVGATPA